MQLQAKGRSPLPAVQCLSPAASNNAVQKLKHETKTRELGCPLKNPEQFSTRFLVFFIKFAEFMANLIALKFASIKNSKTRLGSAIFIEQIRGGQKIGDFRT